MEIKGNEIVRRIDEKRAFLGLSRKELAFSAGLKSAQSITDWGNGSIPQADSALYIADQLNVSVRWLLTGEEEADLTNEERDLLGRFRQLDSRDRADVLGNVEMKLENAKKGDILSSSVNA